MSFGGPARQRAQNIVGALEGAMPVARAYHDPQLFSDAAQQVLADLVTEAAATGSGPLPSRGNGAAPNAG